MKPQQSQHNHPSTQSYFNNSTFQHPTNSPQNLKIKGQSSYIISGTFAQNIQYDKSLSYEKLEIVRVKDNPVIIGRGALSTVYLAKSKKHNQHYVIKEMKKKVLFETLGSTMPILNEMDIHSRINHRNIIKVFNVQENNDVIRIILEYGNQGSLYQIVKRRRGLSERKAFDYFIQAASAIHFLHSNNIIHRDVKPENFVIGDNDILKLCDFGWANKIYENTRDTICGTVEYMAPEIFNREHYDKSIDIWSLGVLLYEIIHDHSPFNKKTNSLNKNYDEIISNIKFHNYTFEKGISKDCEDIIRRMLEKDPKKRITIDEIFYHPFVLHHEKILVGNNAVEYNRVRNYSCVFDELPDIKRQMTAMNIPSTNNLSKHLADKPKKIKHIASFLLSDTIDWDNSLTKKNSNSKPNGNIMKVNTVKTANRLSFQMQIHKDKDSTHGCNTPKKLLSINTNFNNGHNDDDDDDKTIITPVKTMSVKISDMFKKNFKESTTLLDTSSSLAGENDKSHHYV